jgi:hypothetical protein
MTLFNVYCDESCHLENDHQRVMILGAIVCPYERARAIAESIRQRKRQHGLPERFEAKWTKISPGKLSFYLSLVDLFFDDPDLRFRGLVVPDKGDLNHGLFNQDHDTFYYKMYFSMLKVIFTAVEAKYRVYIDIKDTRSAGKERKLFDVLCNAHRDFDHERIQRLQSVRSHEVEQIQLADVLIGALSYANRYLDGSAAKLAVVERIKERSGYSLTVNTSLSAQKINILRWQPSVAP